MSECVYKLNSKLSNYLLLGPVQNNLIHFCSIVIDDVLWDSYKELVKTFCTYFKHLSKQYNEYTSEKIVMK